MIASNQIKNKMIKLMMIHKTKIIIYHKCIITKIFLMKMIANNQIKNKMIKLMMIHKTKINYHKRLMNHKKINH